MPETPKVSVAGRPARGAGRLLALQWAARPARPGRGGGLPALLLVGAGILLVAAVVAYPAFTGNGFVTDVATDMALWATLAVGLNAVLGWAGLLDLGYVAFFAIGGYAYATLSQANVLQFWPALFVGLACSAVAALIIGVPSLRLRSDYLAIMTLGFGEIVYIAARNLNFTGGNNGLFAFHPPTLGGFRFVTPGALYAMAAVLLLVCAGASGLVRRSRLGRAWMSLRDDELAASSFGVSVWRAKLYAYLFGSVWATLAGAVFAAKQGIVSPASFNFDQSFYVLAAVVIGGMGSVWGAVVGGVVYIFLSEALQGVSAGLSGLIFSGLMLAVILLRPQGLVPVSAVARAVDRVTARRRRSLPPSGTAHPTGPSPIKLAPTTLVPKPPALATLNAAAICVQFGGLRAVHEVSLTCTSGSILALIGSNGAGKTTLLNAINGFVPLQSGTITRVRGENALDLTHLSAAGRARHGLARTFQTPRLSRPDSVAENVWRGTLATHQRRREAAERVEQALHTVGLDHLARLPAGELSYGNQRRCEIARALAGQPDFLLLDEPSSGMNEAETAELAALLRTIAANGIALLVVEHDMSLVQAVADTVLAMDVGETIAAGSPAEVLADQTVRRRYLGDS